jgi:hypothetical protein
LADSLNISILGAKKDAKGSPGKEFVSFHLKAHKYIVFDQESKVIIFIVLCTQLLFPNGFYLFISMLTIFLIFYYLQQPLKPGVFTIIAMNHFLQIIAAVWQANIVGKGINYRSPEMSEATVASLIGLTVMFVPIIYFQNKLPSLSLARLRYEADKLSIGNTFNCYLISFFATNFLSGIAFLFGGFTQVIFSLVKIKWLFFLLFGYQSLLKNEKRKLFYFFVLFEFISGFYSFFSEFKTVIYFLVVLLLGLLEIINIKKVMYGALIGGALGVFALVWTQIKGNYRSYLNEGSKEQVAAVSKDDALNKLYDLSTGVDEKDLNSAQYKLLDRLQYTYHFAKTIEMVPSVIPFQNGKNWLDNIEFVTTPRILNPNKPSWDATEKTRKYTGLSYAGRRAGASFSLGYFAECYIDFGLWGMMFPLFLIGLLYGITYWYLMKNSSGNFIFNYSVAGAFFLEFFAFEMDGTLLLGRFLATLVTFFILVKFFFPRIMNYITIPKKSAKSDPLTQGGQI